MARLRITWKKSAIGYHHNQRETIRALGLRRLHHSVEREDNPVVRGMLHKIQHLVTIEEVDEGQEHHGT